MFWKIIRSRLLITIALIFIGTMFLIVNYKGMSIKYEQNQIAKQYSNVSHNKNIGFLEFSALNESYEKVYDEISNIEGINLSNYSVDFLEDGHSKKIIMDKYYYDNFVKGNIQKGRDLEIDDFTKYSEDKMTLPVVIGPEITKEYGFDVGDTYEAICYECIADGEVTSERFGSGEIINGVYVGDEYKGASDEPYININYEVVGILEEDLKVPTMINEDEPGVNHLNDSIITPFTIDKVSLTNEQQQKYEQGLFSYPTINVTVIFDEEDISEREFLKDLSELGKEYQVEVNYRSGVDNFIMAQEQISGYVEVMNVSAFFVTALSMIGLSLLLYKDLKHKKQIYIVYIINGASKSIVFKQQFYYCFVVQLIGNICFLIWFAITSKTFVNLKVLLQVNILYIILYLVINISMYIYFRNKSIRNILSEVEKDD